MEPECTSALSVAVIDGDETRVRQLLAAGFDVHSKVVGPLTCIHIAVEKGHLNITEYLLANGADVNARFPIEEGIYTGSTLLYRAAARGYEAIVEVLFQYGADVNAKNSDGSTSLHIAAEKGFLNVVKILRERGADVNVTHSLDPTKDYYQSKFFENKILRQCLNSNEVDVSNISVYEGKFTPLHVAVKQNHKEVVNLLLELGADINASDENDDSALSLAALSGCSQTLELILSYSPDKNKVCNKRALVHAVKHNNEIYRNIVQKLMDFGIIYDEDVADLEEFFEEMAVENGHFFIIRQLLTGRLPFYELNITTHASSALIVSVDRENLEEVQFLLDRGADPNAEGFYLDGQPLLIAVRKCNMELTRLLIARGASVNETPMILIEASRIGCLEMIKLLLSNGADVNKTSVVDISLYPYLDVYEPYHHQENSALNWNLRVSPLFVAALRGSDDVVKRLLEKNADVNFKSKSCLTPFLISAVGGHSEVTEILLNAGASVKSVDLDGRTALHIAAELGHRDVVKVLLRFGAKVDALVKNSDDRELPTPLLAAAMKGHLSIVEILLQFGASVNFSSSKDSRTALCLAVCSGHDAVVEILLKHGANVNHKQVYGRTALHDAAHLGRIKTVKTLLEYGANVNSLDDEGNNPMPWICKSNADEILQLLFMYGLKFTGDCFANKNNFNDFSQEAYSKTLTAFFKRGSKIDHPALLAEDLLSDALEKGLLGVAKLLSENGVHFHSNEERGKAFLTALREGRSDVIKFLLQHHGADANFADCHGRTALHFAAERGEFDAVKFLLNNKADPNAVNEEGDTPLTLSAKTGCLAVVDILIKAGATLTNANHLGKTAIFLATEYCHADVMMLLLDQGAGVNCQTEFGETPLLVAVRKGHFTLLRPLLKFGANLNLSNKDGQTALHFAAEYGDVNSVKLLLENGAYVNSIANNGLTPLFRSAGRGRFESVELLLRAGADVNVIDLRGFKALNLAAERGYDAIVKLLLERGTDVCCKSADNIPLLLKVAAHGHRGTLDLLMEYGAPLELSVNSLPCCRKWRNAETLTPLLLDGPADIKFISEDTLDALFVFIRELYRNQNQDFNNAIRERYHRLAFLLEYFYIKMKAANFYPRLSIDMEEPFDYRTTHNEFKTTCEREVEKMKNRFISDSHFTVFDILTKSLCGLASLARNQRVMPFLMSEKFVAEFPRYHRMVRSQFKKGVLRRELLDQSVKGFSSSRIVFSSLPLDVIERILLFLRNQDLRILVLSFNAGNSCNSNSLNSSLNLYR